MNKRSPEEIITRLLKCKHKEGVNPNDWGKTNRNLLYVADYVVDFCDDHGIDLVFTSIIRPKLKFSVSKTHEEGRAFDIRTRFNGFTTDLIDQLILELNKVFVLTAPVSLKSGKKITAVYEFPTHENPDVVEHIHCQVKS